MNRSCRGRRMMGCIFRRNKRKRLGLYTFDVNSVRTGDMRRREIVSARTKRLTAHKPPDSHHTSPNQAPISQYPDRIERAGRIKPAGRLPFQGRYKFSVKANDGNRKIPHLLLHVLRGFRSLYGFCTLCRFRIWCGFRILCGFWLRHGFWLLGCVTCGLFSVPFRLSGSFPLPLIRHSFDHAELSHRRTQIGQNFRCPSLYRSIPCDNHDKEAALERTFAVQLPQSLTQNPLDPIAYNSASKLFCDSQTDTVFPFFLWMCFLQTRCGIIAQDIDDNGFRNRFIAARIRLLIQMIFADGFVLHTLFWGIQSSRVCRSSCACFCSQKKIRLPVSQRLPCERDATGH